MAKAPNIPGSLRPAEPSAERGDRRPFIIERGGIDRFNIQEQEHDRWCWAAVAASLATYFDDASTWTQCQVACRVLNKKKNECCEEEIAKRDCNVESELLPSLWAVKLSVKNPPKHAGDDAVAHNEIFVWLKDHRLVPIAIHWQPGDKESKGHFMVVYQYRRFSNGRVFLMVADPATGRSESTSETDEYNDHVLTEGRHRCNGCPVTWTRSYPLPPKARLKADA